MLSGLSQGMQLQTLYLLLLLHNIVGIPKASNQLKGFGTRCGAGNPGEDLLLVHHRRLTRITVPFQ